MKVLFAVAVLVAASSAAAAPFPLTLAHARGVSNVAVGTSTTRLRKELWLDRIGGTGIAHGTATVSCEMRSAVGLTGQDEVLTFSVAARARQVIWRYGGTRDCKVSVSLHGKGLLAVALRGY